MPSAPRGNQPLSLASLSLSQSYPPRLDSGTAENTPAMSATAPRMPFPTEPESKPSQDSGETGPANSSAGPTLTSIPIGLQSQPDPVPYPLITCMRSLDDISESLSIQIEPVDYDTSDLLVFRSQMSQQLTTGNRMTESQLSTTSCSVSSTATQTSPESKSSTSGVDGGTFSPEPTEDLHRQQELTVLKTLNDNVLLLNLLPALYAQAAADRTFLTLALADVQNNRKKIFAVQQAFVNAFKAMSPMVLDLCTENIVLKEKCSAAESTITKLRLSADVDETEKQSQAKASEKTKKEYDACRIELADTMQELEKCQARAKKVHEEWKKTQAQLVQSENEMDEMYHDLVDAPVCRGAFYHMRAEADAADDLRDEVKKWRARARECDELRVARVRLEKNLETAGDLEMEVEKLRKEVQTLGKVKFENGRLKKKLAEREGGRSVSVEKLEGTGGKKKGRGDPMQSVPKGQSNAGSEGVIGDRSNDSSGHSDVRELTRLRVALATAEEAVVKSEAQRLQLDDKIQIEEATAKSWKESSLRCQQDVVRLRKDLERNLDEAALLREEIVVHQQRLAGCICTKYDDGGSNTPPSHAGLEESRVEPSAFEVAAVRMLRKIKTTNRALVQHVDGLKTYDGNAWGIVNATQIHVQDMMMRVEEDIGKVLGMRERDGVKM